MTWPQPHEGIKGKTRKDDLLSLSDRAYPRRVMTLRLFESFYHAVTRNSSRDPDLLKAYQWIIRPEIGDLVVEMSALWTAWGLDPEKTRERKTHGFGILVAKRQEWACSDDEWQTMLEEEPEYGERPTDIGWYVQYGPKPADVCRWANCMFLAIPTEEIVANARQRP